MKLRIVLLAAFLVMVSAAGVYAVTKEFTPDWSLNATIIEACSCPMFCQCYFDHKPASHADHEGMAGMNHGGEHAFCKFNNAYRVNKGSYGGVKLDGAKFWLAGDLGAEFADGEMDWAVLHFDPSVTPEQREGIKNALAYVYPVKWKSFTVGPDAPMEWTATKDVATAKLDGGKIGEVVLKRNQGMSDQPIVIQNLRYFGAPRNTGFVLMQNEVEAYRSGDKPYEYKGTNGFMITLDINSKDVKPKS
ncbi:MAG TPA: DUF1326 domain-containing protein [Candidatus Eisenbacteria bacterium]|jgi:hypothetical protein|nr:DUF1326 domain-containing protein [Candidatus Eisenbacteria bacterium]